MHVRVCPECDEEYRPDIATCADCGADLVDRQTDEQGRALPEPAQAVQPIALAALYSGPAAALKPLADALADAGVPQRFVPIPGQSGLTLAVAQDEAARALTALSAFHGRGTELGIRELAATFEAQESEHEHACPACGAAVPAGASLCSDCGLDWGGDEPPPPSAGSDD
jgi:predicted amidophosphoribosyltransferase